MLWRLETGDDMPTVKNTFYIGLYLYAVDTDSGECAGIDALSNSTHVVLCCLHWLTATCTEYRYPQIDGAMRGTLVNSEGVVYVGTLQGLHALEAETGKLLWRYEMTAGLLLIML